MCQAEDCENDIWMNCDNCVSVNEWNKGILPLLCAYCMSESNHRRHVLEFMLALDE